MDFSFLKWVICAQKRILFSVCFFFTLGWRLKIVFPLRRAVSTLPNDSDLWHITQVEYIIQVSSIGDNRSQLMLGICFLFCYTAVNYWQGGSGENPWNVKRSKHSRKSWMKSTIKFRICCQCDKVKWFNFQRNNKLPPVPQSQHNLNLQSLFTFPLTLINFALITWFRAMISALARWLFTQTKRRPQLCLFGVAFPLRFWSFWKWSR